MNRHLATTCLAFASLLLVGCSNSNTGNSSSASSVSSSSQAQGVYVGSTAMGQAFDGIILPNDQFYALYGTSSGNVLYICGLATGQGTSSNGSYSATETDFDYCDGYLAIYSGNIAGTYAAGASISGSITENGRSEAFTGTAPATSLFSYNTAASLGSIAGSWSGSLTDGETAYITIGASGSMSGVSSLGCTFSGTITPDSSDKNFFDISFTFGGSPCDLPNQGASGIAVDYLLSDGVTSQLLAAASSGNSFGIVFAAQR